MVDVILLRGRQIFIFKVLIMCSHIRIHCKRAKHMLLLSELIFMRALFHLIFPNFLVDWFLYFVLFSSSSLIGKPLCAQKMLLHKRLLFSLSLAFPSGLHILIVSGFLRLLSRKIVQEEYTFGEQALEKRWTNIQAVLSCCTIM